MRVLLFVLALSLAAAPTHGATERLPPEAVVLTSVAPLAGLDATVGSLQRQVRAGLTEDALATLNAISEPLRREATAARLLERLQQHGDPLPAVLLDGIAAWPVKVFRRQEETLADWFVPVFDLPAQVQSLRTLAARSAAVDALRAVIEAAPDTAAAKALTEADPRVAALAVRAASHAAVARLAVAEKAGRTPLPGPVLAEIASRRADAASLLRAIDAAEPLDVLPLFASTVPSLAPADAKAAMRTALSRPEYASSAAFALVALPRDAEIDAMLAAALKDRSVGASVAAALASSTEGIARFDALLQDGGADATTLTHLALALRLHGDDAARDRLDRLMADPRLPATVRTELLR